jgi:signal transduction histidine kinase/ligand-binding sensor domain-containing protein
MISTGKQETWIVEVRVPFRTPKRPFHFFTGCALSRRFLACLTLAVLLGLFAATPARGDSLPSQVDPLSDKIDLVDGNDIRFQRLSAGTGLSQTRVAWLVQDKVGFMWFGTQYGLNRYDGYKSKVFKHEPDRSDSLSCVYVRSLLVDHAGTLWVGCDRFLDRFDPATETFKHYRIYTEISNGLPTPIDRIREDHEGVLWLATAKGLYRFDPNSGRTTRYVHDPHDPNSLVANRINVAAEDREGRLWVASANGLDQVDSETGKVLRRAPFHNEVSEFHEDKFGMFWMTGSDSSCALASWDLQTDLVKCHTLNYSLKGIPLKAVISEIVESRSGSMWLSSTAGLLKFDRARDRFIRYHNNPIDRESLESDNLIFLYQDHEGNIWTCSQAAEPNFFSEEPLPFQNFTYQRGTLVNPLVTSIYEDKNGILWIGSMGGLNRIDRRTGTNTVPAGSGVGNEILSILEDGKGVLFAGTFHKGLQEIKRNTGEVSPYPRGLPAPYTSPIMQLIYDRGGNLWAAMYGGVGRLDAATGRFVMYSPENQNTIQYQKIAEDREGFLWLGAQSGLHRFDPRTGQFTIYGHKPDDPGSLSDNRVNSVHFDQRGTLWVGTQDGLSKFNRQTGTFENYYEKDGLAGDVVSCIQEDRNGVLWMGTNKGLSGFDLHSQRFRNFSAADGLPGQDLTGWGTCHQSPSGEMFFGGFSGATAFYPNKIVNSSYVPRTVLTDFRLSGNPVHIGAGSVLKQSITLTDAITLSHQQSIFSIEFSALSFFNAATNRYRYKLNGLDEDWHEVGSDERVANYTTLPAASYTFEVQGATSRGPWSEPGAVLHIKILPAWYQTLWFRSICVAAFLLLLWAIYLLRLNELRSQFSAALDARVDERTRIARELHDTLLQSCQGLLLVFQSISNLLPERPDEAKQRIEHALDQAADAITEGRDAVHELRSGGLNTVDLGEAISKFGKDLLSDAPTETAPVFSVQIEGTPRPLNPILRDEVYRIGVESLRNAVRHANARRIEVDIRYGEDGLRLRIRDNGKGIDPVVLGQEEIAGHWGLRGMRERAKLIGGTFEVWSQLGSGTETELTIPAASAYSKPRDHRGFTLSRLWRS